MAPDEDAEARETLAAAMALVTARMQSLAGGQTTREYLALQDAAMAAHGPGVISALALIGVGLVQVAAVATAQATGVQRSAEEILQIVAVQLAQQGL